MQKNSGWFIIESSLNLIKQTFDWYLKIFHNIAHSTKNNIIRVVTGTPSYPRRNPAPRKSTAAMPTPMETIFNL